MLPCLTFLPLPDAVLSLGIQAVHVAIHLPIYLHDMRERRVAGGGWRAMNVPAARAWGDLSLTLVCSAQTPVLWSTLVLWSSDLALGTVYIDHGVFDKCVALSRPGRGESEVKAADTCDARHSGSRGSWLVRSQSRTLNLEHPVYVTQSPICMSQALLPLLNTGLSGSIYIRSLVVQLPLVVTLSSC